MGVRTPYFPWVPPENSVGNLLARLYVAPSDKGEGWLDWLAC